jgi:hypothetical protein
MSNQLKITEANISCDWESTTPTMYPGQEVTEEVKVSREVFTKFMQSFSQLLEIGMENTASASLEGVGSASSKFSMKSVTEFKESYEKQVTDKWSHDTLSKWTVPSNAIVGTLITQANVVCGGLIISIPTSAITKAWTIDEIVETVGSRYYTDALRSAVSGKIGPKPEFTPAVYQPVKGLTCHHRDFREPKIDNCHDDGKYCLELDGKSFVVCHHHNMQWYGGSKCNCSHVDGQNVIVVSASSLNEDYYK